MLNIFAKKNLIGLDIGTSTVKIVELDEIKGKYKEKYKLKNLGVNNIEPEEIFSASVSQSSISDRHASSSEEVLERRARR